MSRKRRKPMTRLLIKIKQMGLTQKQAAERIGSSTSTLNRLCLKGIRTLGKAEHIAEKLGCPWQEIMG